MPDHMLTAVEQLTTQVRRIADALTTPADSSSSGYRPTTVEAPGAQPVGPAGASTAHDELRHVDPNTARRRAGLPPHPADEEQLHTARRDSLGVLLSRAGRGVLSRDEGALLRQHVEGEIREADTARAVAAGNLRHVQTLVPELERAQAAIGCARKLAQRWGVLRAYGSAAAELRAALDGTAAPDPDVSAADMKG